MTKEIIETEIERLFPQFNAGEVKAATMACEWMQKVTIQKTLEKLIEHIGDEELVKYCSKKI